MNKSNKLFNISDFKEPVEGIFIEPTNKIINVCEFNDKENINKIIVGKSGSGKMYTKEELLKAYKHCGGNIEDYRILGDVLEDYIEIKTNERK